MERANLLKNTNGDVNSGVIEQYWSTYITIGENVNQQGDILSSVVNHGLWNIAVCSNYAKLQGYNNYFTDSCVAE